MTDISSFLASIRRPGLLIRAARFGLVDYRRDRDLRRLLGTSTPPSSERAFHALAAAEQDLEATRRLGDARYSVSRHVEVLIALLGEARHLRTAP